MIDHRDANVKDLLPGTAQEERRHRLAQEHVEWFLRAIRPLLIDHFIHGYKHGREDTEDGVDDPGVEVDKEYSL